MSESHVSSRPIQGLASQPFLLSSPEELAQGMTCLCVAVPLIPINQFVTGDARVLIAGGQGLPKLRIELPADPEFNDIGKDGAVVALELRAGSSPVETMIRHIAAVPRFEPLRSIDRLWWRTPTHVTLYHEPV